MLTAGLTISNTPKWPCWAWPAKFGPYQTRPYRLSRALIDPLGRRLLSGEQGVEDN
jgi:hypothetical protein